MVDESFQTSKPECVKYQYFAMAVVNILMISNGIILGWSSPSIHLLTSDKSPFPSGKITMNEASWIASLMDVGSLVGCLLFGYTTLKLSRKWILTFIPIPIIASWCLILVAQNIYYLYVARVLQGIIFTGIKITIYSFVIEISADRIRGFVMSFINLTFVAGVIIAFTLGTFGDFYTIPKFVMGLVVLFSVLFYFIPESPIFLIKQNKISEAEKSIRFYKNLSKKDDEMVKVEIETIMTNIGDLKSKDSEKNLVKWTDYVTPPGRQAMIIALFMVTISQFCGLPPMMTYTANIFRESGSTLTPNMSTIVVGLIKLAGACVAIFLVNRVKRKVILISSAIGMAASEITLGTYTMLKSWNYDVETHNWIPLVSFSVFVFAASGGFVAVVFVIIAEVMPLKLKDVGMTFSVISLLLSQFVMVKFFPLLSNSIGFHGSMFLFAGICLMSTVFTVFYIPETRGKSREQIMNLLK